MTTLLEQSLELDNLRRAWEAIEDNQGIPGLDKVSIRRWRRNWEERLANLADAVRCNTYQPKKLHKQRIPKRDRREFRVLRIPTVTDRVLQRAVLQVLHPVFEGGRQNRPVFLDCSYGYRPGRGLREAVQRIIVLRENGYRWLLDADIDEFFDSVDHTLLLEFLRHDLPDASLLPLIERWLDLGRADPRRAVGISLGSPISPLWANIFLHRLDVSIQRSGWPLVRYADDFIVFAESQTQAAHIHEEVGKVLASLHLQYEPHKTRLCCFDEGFDFIGVHFEGDEYSYTYLDKEIKVSGSEVDMLFSQYGPEY